METLKIIDYLHVGRKNAETRQDLALTTGLSDRKIRLAIEEAREAGEVIISSHKHPGYWLPENEEEIQEFVKMIRCYIFSLWRTTKSARQVLRKNRKQTTIKMK